LSRAALRSKRNTPSAVIIPKKKFVPYTRAAEPHQAMRFIAFLKRFTLT
jgi:hypothetical protein